jgi:hypothetical protein
VHVLVYTGCPTRYRTRHFFNNSNTNEDIATKFEQQYVLFFYISYTMRSVRFKFRCNILISGKIMKEMPGSVASETPCINDLPYRDTLPPATVRFHWCVYVFVMS